MKRRHDEHDFQVATYEYLRLILPAGAILTSIDHAGAGKIVGAERKRRGVLAGVADIYVGYGATTLWLECKAKRGTLQSNQVAFRDLVRAQGHYWAAPKTLEQVEIVLRSTPIPLRNSVTLLPSGAIFAPVQRGGQQ